MYANTEIYVYIYVYACIRVYVLRLYTERGKLLNNSPAIYFHEVHALGCIIFTFQS